MISVLNIAEKNSVAKQIAKHLSQGSSTTTRTLSKFNPNYEFEIPSQKYKMKVSSVRGHVIEYTFHKQYMSWSQHNPRIFFKDVECLIKPNDGMKDLIDNLQMLARGVQLLILWLDCDRQGEAIAFQVIQIIKKVAPKVAIKRARFSAVTKTDVWRAFKNLVEPNQFEADAVNYRRQVDLRLGVAFTIFQTLTLQNSLGTNGTVSYGPCQFPTLGFVVERYLKVKNFIPQKFWVIKAYYVNEVSKQKVQFKWKRNRLFCEISTNILYLNIIESFPNNIPQAKITNQVVSDKKKFKPYPLATIQLQKIGTKKLGMSSHKIMEVAEKLYQKGYISYPRTQTTAYPITMNMINLVKLFEQGGSYQQYASKLIHNDKFLKPRNGNKNDQAHPPIHPVKSIPKDSLNSDQWKVYDLITRHFLASCSKDAQGLQKLISIDIGEESFRATHLEIISYNYLEIYTFEKWNESTIPAIPKKFIPLLEITSSQTSAPGYLTQSQLIGLMDKNQIGTDSTIHEHINTIQQRNYAVKTNNTLKPTPLGCALVQTYNNMGIALSNCSVRRNIEANMNQIASKRLKRQQAVEKTIMQMIPIYQKLVAQKPQWISQMRTLLPNSQSSSVFNDKIICHICLQQLILKEDRLCCNRCNYKYAFPPGNYSKTDFKCPFCQCLVLEVFKGKKKFSDNICLVCYNSTQGRQVMVECENCTYSCPKAKGAMKKQLFSCSQCKHKTILKSSKTGGMFISCISWPQCKSSFGIKSFVKSIYLTQQKCPDCEQQTMALLGLEKRLIDDIHLEIKLLYLQQKDTNYLLCFNPICNPALFEQNGFQNQSNNPTSNTFTSLPKNTVKCYKCQQTGHYSNACPNNKNNNHTKVNPNQYDSTQEQQRSQYQNTRIMDKWKNNKINNSSRSKNNKRNKTTDASNFNSTKYTCYSCNQKGHIAPNCPNKNVDKKNNRVQKQKTSAGCIQCGHIGRHPKGSNCPKLKKK